MKTGLYIGLFFSLVLSACLQHDMHKDRNEQFAIHQLILLRTEGLILAEMTQEYTARDEIRRMCEKIIGYYQDTHPGFLEICRERVIDIQDKHFDSLWNRTDDFLRANDDNMEVALINLCQDNITRSIALYEIIIQDNEWEDISYFSFLALPDLYNQQEELNALENKLERNAHPDLGGIPRNNPLTKN